MTRFTLDCIGDGFKKGKWRFREQGKDMTVTDPDGNLVCRFPHDQADHRFVLPSFWQSIKHVGLKMDGGATVWFHPGAEAVATIKEYLDAALAARGIEAVQRLRKTGWITLFTGLGCILFGCAVLVVADKLLGVKNRHAEWALAAMILAGIGQTAWAIRSLFRAGRLKRHLRKKEAPSA